VCVCGRYWSDNTVAPSGHVIAWDYRRSWQCDGLGTVKTYIDDGCVSLATATALGGAWSPIYCTRCYYIGVHGLGGAAAAAVAISNVNMVTAQ